MMNLTKKQWEAVVDTCNYLIERDRTSSHSENLKIVAQIALACLKTEPVDIHNWTFTGLLYPAPPVVMVLKIPDPLPEREDEDGCDIDYMQPSEIYKMGVASGFNKCIVEVLRLNVGE